MPGSRLPTGRYAYDAQAVYRLVNRDVIRKTYVYARVSTSKQKKALERQVEHLKQWSMMNGHTLNGIFTDIASGISFEKRRAFFEMLQDILAYRVEKVIITHKDRLSRVAFGLFKYLFEQYGTKILVISELGNAKLEAEEVFEEIISLLHCYSMKLYSRRRGKKKERALEIKVQ